MHTPDNHPWTRESGCRDKAQELTRNNMEVAGLVVYFFMLAMFFTIVTIMMLFGTGVVTDSKASMQKDLEVKSRLPEFTRSFRRECHTNGTTRPLDVPISGPVWFAVPFGKLTNAAA